MSPGNRSITVAALFEDDCPSRAATVKERL
jgi:hypothetical protein